MSKLLFSISSALEVKLTIVTKHLPYVVIVLIWFRTPVTATYKMITNPSLLVLSSTESKAQNVLLSSKDRKYSLTSKEVTGVTFILTGPQPAFPLSEGQLSLEQQGLPTEVGWHDQC